MWADKTSVKAFGEVLVNTWASEYAASANVADDELVVVDPGNGFNYLFDLAGSAERSPQATFIAGRRCLGRSRNLGD